MNPIITIWEESSFILERHKVDIIILLSKMMKNGFVSMMSLSRRLRLAKFRKMASVVKINRWKAIISLKNIKMLIFYSMKNRIHHKPITALRKKSRPSSVNQCKKPSWQTTATQISCQSCLTVTLLDWVKILVLSKASKLICFHFCISIRLFSEIGIKKNIYLTIIGFWIVYSQGKKSVNGIWNRLIRSLSMSFWCRDRGRWDLCQLV